MLCDVTFRMFRASGSSYEETGVDTTSGREKSVEEEGQGYSDGVMLAD